MPSLVSRPLAVLRDFFSFTPAPGAVRAAIPNAAISVATFAVCCVLFGPKAGSIGMLGAMVPFWETGRPLFSRLRVMPLVAAGLCACMSLGILVSPLPGASLWASVAVVLVVGLIYQTFMLTGGPSPAMMFYACVIGSYFGTRQSQPWLMVGVTAFSALLATALLLARLALDPRGPERRAVAAALSALAATRGAEDAEDNKGTALSHAARRRANAAAARTVAHAGLTLHAARPAHTSPTHRRLRAALATGVGQTNPQPLPTRPGARFLLGRSLHANSLEWFLTWRMALAAGLAGAASMALGLGHPYWAILTATIILNQWIAPGPSALRATHRTVGTLVGVLLTSAVFLIQPPEWVAIAVVAAAMCGMYLLLPGNYSWALAAITPMALVSSGLTAGWNETTAADRLLDTVVAALASVAVMLLSSRGFPTALLARQQGRVRRGTAAVAGLGQCPTPGAGLSASRRPGAGDAGDASASENASDVPGAGGNGAAAPARTTSVARLHLLHDLVRLEDLIARAHPDLAARLDAAETADAAHLTLAISRAG